MKGRGNKFSIIHNSGPSPFRSLRQARTSSVIPDQIDSSPAWPDLDLAMPSTALGSVPRNLFQLLKSEVAAVPRCDLVIINLQPLASPFKSFSYLV